MKDVLLKLVLSSLAAQLSYGAFAAGIQDDDQRRKCRTVQGLTEIVRDIEEKHRQSGAAHAAAARRENPF